MTDSAVQFLKLGGSLITDKSRPHNPRLDVLDRLAGEIAAALKTNPALRLLVGHGSGSFGHVPANRYGTRQGVRDKQGWKGFVEVWQEAAALNRLVLDALSGAGLPVLGMSPLASIVAEDGRVAAWNLEPLQMALQAGLIPVIQGDTVFDRRRGGTILSTEDLFNHLIRFLHPARILLAGRESGVWMDYPHCTSLIQEITPSDHAEIKLVLSGSSDPDVTGGMVSKVEQSLHWVQEHPGLHVYIFSGEEPGAVQKALLWEVSGTSIHA